MPQFTKRSVISRPLWRLFRAVMTLLWAGITNFNFRYWGEMIGEE